MMRKPRGIQVLQMTQIVQVKQIEKAGRDAA
jgi:hypothetical protein